MAASVEWFDDLDAVAADACGALDRVRQPSLYDRLDWFRLTRAHVMPDVPLAVLRLREGEAAAWLFLIETGKRRAAPLASWYTLRFAPIFSAGGERLMPDLSRALKRRFDVVTLQPLSTLPGLAGWAQFATRSSTNWSIQVREQDFSRYWSGRPARLRNTLARRALSHPVEIAIHRRFDPASWSEYEEVYGDSWKPAEGSAAFLRALAEQEGAAGTLRLGLAHDGTGRAVATQFWLVEDGVATIHKLAHREASRAGSPGSLLSRAMFEHAIDRDRVRRIDFGLGNDPYKADWMDDARPVWRADAYRLASVRGLAGAGREAASRLVRRSRTD